MRVNWSSLSTALLQKWAYYTTSLSSLQTAAHTGDQIAMYTNLQYKWNDPQTNHSRETINSIEPSNNMSPQRSYIGNGAEFAAVCDTGVVSVTSSTTAVVNTKSAVGLDNVQSCIVGLPLSKIVSKCPLTPLQLHTQLIQNCRKKLKTLQNIKPTSKGRGMDV